MSKHPGDNPKHAAPDLSASAAEPVGLMDEASFEASLIDSRIGEGSSIDPMLTEDRPDHAVHQPAWVGKQLGHFRLLRLIGRGSMGLVIQARDVNLHRIVALKVLRKRISGMDERHRIDQFLREARAAAQIEHPNIVRVYEINEHDGWWYIAMEMIEGETLRDVVKAVGRLGPERACPILADAATALAVAHESGIIHRDVKPNNLMITRTGRGKLADFGLVRVSDPNDPFDFTDKSVGTPQYMAPEIIEGKRATPAVDIYGLGGTLFFALTGHPPYAAANLSAILRQHCSAPVPDLREKLPQCTDSLVELVKRAMAKKPEDRPTAVQFAAALRAETIAMRTDENGVSGAGGSWSAVLAGSGIHPPVRRRPAYWTPKRMLGIAAAAIPLVLALAAVVYFALPAGDSTRSDPPAASSKQVQRYLADTFPDAPPTWGTREPGSRPVAAQPDPDNPPPFSWRSDSSLTPDDLAAKLFIASPTGRYYWPIDHPAATLIRGDPTPSLYPDASAAASAGNRPAPNDGAIP